MSNLTTFLPSASVSYNPDIIAGSFAMPSVDGSNVETQIVCTGSPTWIGFGTGVAVGPNAPGSILLQPGAPVLLTNAAATLAATTTNPNVIGGVPATTAANATAAAAMTTQRGGTVTVSRGTTTARGTF